MDRVSNSSWRESHRLRNVALVVLGAATVFALGFIPPFDNELWLVKNLLGPLLTGLVMRLRGWPWKLGAAAWALMWLTGLVWDWVVKEEDQLFHAMAILVAVGLVAAGAGLGALIESSRLRGTRQHQS